MTASAYWVNAQRLEAVLPIEGHATRVMLRNPKPDDIMPMPARMIHNRGHELRSNARAVQCRRNKQLPQFERIAANNGVMGLVLEHHEADNRTACLDYVGQACVFLDQLRIRLGRRRPDERQ